MFKSSLFSGPGVNKAVLLQLQQERAKARQELELANDMKQAYDNMCYENNEIKQEADSNTKAPKNGSRPSKLIENQLEEQVERTDSF